MSLLEVQVLTNLKVDAAQEVTLKVTRDGRGERVFVQFNCDKPKLCIQKNFPNTLAGRADAEAFSVSIQSLADMKAHLKIKE